MRTTALRLSLLCALGLGIGLACREEMPDRRARSLAVYPTKIEGEPRIRILVADGLERAKLSVSGAYDLTIVALDGREQTGGGGFATAVEVTPAPQGLQLGQDLVRRATITPKPGKVIALQYTDADGRPVEQTYPYPMTLLRADAGGSSPGRLRAVVTPGFEEYLVGVVAHEMYPTWPLEALRAQASQDWWQAERARIPEIDRAWREMRGF